MEDLVEIIAFFSSITAVITVSSLLTLKVYFSIRRCFPISVNCWFCDTWSRVPYDNRNSFDCPNCCQYNGFTEDGGYNKVIEAQHKFTKTPPTKSHKNSNGLCTSCNHNQQLKITQLAKFKPLVEENYDEEIEHFRSQLEEAYELCPPCHRFLKTTLLREKAAFFGNHVFNIQKKGKNLYEKLMKKSETNSSGSNLLKLLRTVQGILATLVILNVTTQVLSRAQFVWFTDYLLPYLEVYEDISILLSALDDKLFSTLNILAALVYRNFEVLTAFGLFIQLPLFIMEETLACVKMNQILCWSFLALVSWTNNEEMLMNSFQIVCACFIVYNSFYEFETSPRSIKKMKKLPPSCDNSYSEDFSDNEDFTPTHNKTVINKKMTDKFTANSVFNRMPPNIGNAANINYCVRTELEDLQPRKSPIKINEVDLPFSRSSSPKSKQGLLSPAKLNHIDKNSWVAGGFWKLADGTLIPINQHLTNCNSRSSGFYSQTNDRLSSVFSQRQFDSLPVSVETSLSGDFDRLSLAPKSPQISPIRSPPMTMNMSYAMSNNSRMQNSWTSDIRYVGYTMPTTSPGYVKSANLFKSHGSSVGGSPRSTFSFGMPVAL